PPRKPPPPPPRPPPPPIRADEKSVDSDAGVSIAKSCDAPEAGAARAPIVVAARNGKETASKPADMNRQMVLDISPPSRAERLARILFSSAEPPMFTTLSCFRPQG